MANYEQVYSVGLLDDLHNFFPDILYRPQRFRTVQDLLQYISQQTQTRFNLFDRGLRRFEQSSAPQRQTITLPQIPRVSSIPPPPPNTHASTVAASATPYMNIVTETFDITPVLTSLLGGDIPRTENTTSAVPSTLTTLDAFLALLRPPQNLDPVVVTPTQEQINTATHVFECLREQDQISLCSICQDDFTDNILVRQIRQCNHMFHKQCIDQWFRQNTHCPVCRFDIRDHSANSSE
jgi:hypothetical protein